MSIPEQKSAGDGTSADKVGSTEARAAANLEHTQRLAVLLSGKKRSGNTSTQLPKLTPPPVASSADVAAEATATIKALRAASQPLPQIKPAPMVAQARPTLTSLPPVPGSTVKAPAVKAPAVLTPVTRLAPVREPVYADTSNSTIKIKALNLDALTEQGKAPHLAIKRATLQLAGYLPSDSLERQFADYYRRIKRPLIARAMSAEASGVGKRLIMLASALPGDGKTFTSLNLAFSIARERDISVLLIDADVAKPHVSRILGVEREPGLLDALVSETTDPESFVMQTNVPGLAVLPAGRHHERATELLASDRMTAIVSMLERNDAKRIILFDSPPLLVSSESRALATFAGQVVLVVCAGKTPHAAVLNALSQFPEGKQINLVLNQGLTNLTDDYFNYGGYGSYGAYGGESVPQS